MENDETRFREIYYSSLLEQLQVNETNRIKIILFFTGGIIASIVGTIKVIQPISNLLLLFFFPCYFSWIYSLHILHKKLKVDDEVIDEKIKRIGTEKEKQDPPNKETADKLEKRFYKFLISPLIYILICILTYILITAYISKGDQMANKETTQERKSTQETVINTTNRRSTDELSYGGRLPGGFQSNRDNPPNQTQGQEQETAPPQSSDSETPTGSENTNQETDQKPKTE